MHVVQVMATFATPGSTRMQYALGVPNYVPLATGVPLNHTLGPPGTITSWKIISDRDGEYQVNFHRAHSALVNLV